MQGARVTFSYKKGRKLFILSKVTVTTHLEQTTVIRLPYQKPTMTFVPIASYKKNNIIVF